MNTKKKSTSAINPKNRNSDSGNPGNMFPESNKKPEKLEKKGINPKPRTL